MPNETSLPRNALGCPHCGWGYGPGHSCDTDALKPYRIDQDIAPYVSALAKAVLEWKQHVIQRHVQGNTYLLRTPAGQRILSIYLKQEGYCFRYWPDGKIEFAKGDQILATFKHELKTL